MIRMLQTAVIVAWLVVGCGPSYAALFLFPAPSDPMSPAPTPPDLSVAYLPLLAALLILGIIRRFGNARRGVDAATPPLMTSCWPVTVSSEAKGSV